MGHSTRAHQNGASTRSPITRVNRGLPVTFSSLFFLKSLDQGRLCCYLLVSQVTPPSIAYGQKIGRSLIILTHEIAVEFTNVMRLQVLYAPCPFHPSRIRLSYQMALYPHGTDSKVTNLIVGSDVIELSGPMIRVPASMR